MDNSWLSGYHSKPKLGSSHEEEVMGAYYIYSQDDVNSEYSIALYARQSAFGGAPVYGATMLQTLA